jgi:hypothetical protein
MSFDTTHFGVGAAATAGPSAAGVACGAVGCCASVGRAKRRIVAATADPAAARRRS